MNLDHWFYFSLLKVRRSMQSGQSTPVNPRRSTCVHLKLKNCISGGVRPLSPPRHDITALEEPFRARGSIYLSSFFIVNFSTRTCLSGSSLISLSLLGFWVGSSLFGILFVKPLFFVNLISMSMFRFWVMGLK